MKLKEHILRLKKIFYALNRIHRTNRRLEDMLPKRKGVRTRGNSTAGITSRHLISRVTNMARERVKSEALNKKTSLRNVHNNINKIYNNGLKNWVAYKNSSNLISYEKAISSSVKSLKNMVAGRAAFYSDYSQSFGESKENKENINITSINKLLSLNSFPYGYRVNIASVGQGAAAACRKNLSDNSVRALNMRKAVQGVEKNESIKKLTGLTATVNYHNKNTVASNLPAIRAHLKSVASIRAAEHVMAARATDIKPSADLISLGTDIKKGINKNRLSGVKAHGPLTKTELNFLNEGNKHNSTNENILSAKNIFNQKTFFNKASSSDEHKNNISFNVKVDFNAYSGSLSTREEMESFAGVFVKQLERELNTFAEGLHL